MTGIQKTTIFLMSVITTVILGWGIWYVLSLLLVVGYLIFAIQVGGHMLYMVWVALIALAPFLLCGLLLYFIFGIKKSDILRTKLLTLFLVLLSPVPLFFVLQDDFPVDPLITYIATTFILITAFFAFLSYREMVKTKNIFHLSQ